MTKIKLLHLITRLDKGGSTDNTLYSALLADKARFAVTVASGPSADPAGALQQEAEKAGVTFLSIPELGREIDLVRDFQCLLHLVSLFRAERYGIIHTHTSKAGILGRWAARIARIPAVVHTPHGHVFFGYYGPLLTRFFILIERITSRVTRRLVAISEAEKEDYRYFGIISPEKISVIPSGIDLAGFSCPQDGMDRASLGLTPDDFVLGTVARLEPVKNHQALIIASRLFKNQIPDFKWLFIGDGELKDQLYAQVRQAGLEKHIIFMGWRNDISRLLPQLDVFVLASHNEGMGRAIVEAQACGLPVVAADICGIRDLVQDEETGFLVSPESPPLFAERILWLYHNPEERKAMGQKAKQGLRPEYRVEHMVSSLEKLYLTLVKQ